MRNLLTILLLLGVLAGALALTQVSPTPLPRTLAVVPPLESKLVCAPMSTAGRLHVDGAEGITPLGQEEEPAAGATLVEEQLEPVVIRGGAGLRGGDVVTASGARAFVPCTAPRSQGIILLPDTATTDLLIVNPDSSEAVVDLSIHGVDGEIVALGARGVAVSPNSSRTIALSVLVDTPGPVGVEHRASRGRAAVVARTEAPGLLETATSFAAGTEHALAGIPAGATAATLLLTNPGTERATVDVIAFGRTLSYAPQGGARIAVPPNATVAVELATSLAGEATGLRVTSDVEVAAGLSTTLTIDSAFAAPVVAAPELGAFAPAGGILQLSNPGTLDATVQVVLGVLDADPVTTEVSVVAGTTLEVPMAADAPRGQTVRVTSDAPLFGAVVDVVAGATVVPLTPQVAPVVEPVAAEIVPTLR